MDYIELETIYKNNRIRIYKPTALQTIQELKKIKDFIDSDFSKNLNELSKILTKKGK